MPVNTLIALAVAALLIFWSVGAYNRLVRLKNAIAVAFNLLDAQLHCRFDVIPRVVDAAKAYLARDSVTLEAVTLASNQVRSASELVRSRPMHAGAVATLAGAEAVLVSSLARLDALADACPELKADSNLGRINEELAHAESKVVFARQAYNDAVLDYNQAQGEFPTVVVARLFGFGPSVLLQSTQRLDERAVPEA